MPLFRQLFDEDTATFTYLLADAETREAVIIDPVLAQHDRDLALLGKLGLTLRYTLETHVHADHVTGSGRLREVTEAQIAIGEASGVACADIFLSDGDVLSFGHESLIALSTPGHTLGCTSFLWHDRLFTGDTLLIGGTGRTDFQQGDAGQLYDSLQRLFQLPDEILVYPGHDYAGRRVSSLGEERRLNPRIAGFDRAAFIAAMEDLTLPYPRYIDKALPANQICGRNAA